MPAIDSPVHARILQNLSHNYALAPVFKLSDDLLSQIFLLSILGDVPFTNWYRIEKGSDTFRRQEIHTHKYVIRTATFISQVCQNWRQVALENPLLWRHVMLNEKGLNWGLELLKRSANSTIDLRCLDIKVLNNYITPGLVSRLHSYSGVLSQKMWHSILLELQKPTSPLQSIHCFPYTNAMQLASEFVPAHCKPSSLKVLSVRTFTDFSFRLPLFSSLSTLVLIGGDTKLRYHIKDVVEVLVTMPSLENLSLCDVLKGSSGTNPNPLHQVNLSRLRYLEADDGYKKLVLFVRHILVSPSCALNLRVRVHQRNNFETLITLVAEKLLHDQVSADRRTLTIDITPRSILIDNKSIGVYRSGPYDPSIREHILKEITKCTSLTIYHESPEFPSPWHFYFAPLSNLVETLSDSVVSLFLDFNHKVNNVDPRVLLLDRFKSLTHLYAATPETLSAVLSIHKFDNGRRIIFPKLEKLGLVFNPLWRPLPSAIFEELVMFLKWQTTRVNTAELIQPWQAYELLFITTDELRTLRSLVDNIHLFYFVDHGVLLSTDFDNKSAPKVYRVKLQLPEAEWVAAYPRTLVDETTYALMYSGVLQFN